MKTIPYNTGPTCAVLFPSKALAIVKVEDMQCFKGEKAMKIFFNASEALDFPFSTHRSNKKNMWPGQDALPEFFIKACNQFNCKKCIRMQLVGTPVNISKKIENAIKK